MSSPRGSAQLLVAGSGLGIGFDWRRALDEALDGAVEPLREGPPDLLVLFASAGYSESYEDLLAAARERTKASQIVGCSASAVIAGERELEDEPGIAALALRLPAGSLLHVRSIGADELESGRVDWPERLGLSPRACTGLIVLVDPFTTDAPAFIAALEQAYPGSPIMGGLATGAYGLQRTFVFTGERIAANGAVVIALGGAVGLRPVVSQGCEPIGQPWTVTDASGHVVKGIGGRQAYEVLLETVRELDAERRERVNHNLLVGIAMDEYRDEFKRGDFLIRNLMGVDPSSGAIGVGADVGVGQTLQFQIRDAQAADAELRQMLGAEAGGSAGAALLFACNGRGMGLFGAADHDASTVRELLGPLPLAGLFCNGEIGPVGAHTYLHGFTASLALIAPTESGLA